VSSETTRVESLTVERLGPGRFRVTRGSEPHLVDLTAATCPDQRYRHRICKHVAAVDRYVENAEAEGVADTPDDSSGPRP